MEREFEAILFDIDGTLVDSTPAVERTWRAWARRHGHDPERILAVSHGRRTRDTLADFLPTDQIDAAEAELLDMEMNDLEGVVALPGVRELLSALPETAWAAVTSGGRGLMTRRLEAADVPVPKMLISADDVERGKPDPQGYRKAAEALGADPERCLVVEDAPAGIRAGKNLGAYTVGVATSHPADQLGEADLVIEDLTRIRVAATAAGVLVDVIDSKSGGATGDDNA